MAVPIADPESLVQGGTKTEEKWPSVFHLVFHSQFRPHPPGYVEGKCRWNAVPCGLCEDLEDSLRDHGGRSLAFIGFDPGIEDWRVSEVILSQGLSRQYSLYGFCDSRVCIGRLAYAASAISFPAFSIFAMCAEPGILGSASAKTAL